MSLARKNIEKVTPYQAGKPIEETRREFKLKDVVKLASNENPFGASPKAVEAARKALKSVHRYPDPGGYCLKRKLARAYNLEADQIIIGNGSDELIDIVIKTFVEDDEQVITAETTFLEYGIIAGVLGRQVVTVPLRYFTYDLEAIRKNITGKTKIVFIANPNNPTGTYVNERSLREFLMKIPAHVIVVIDEAYDTFIDVTDFPSTLRYVRTNNVIVLKTFSKAYGLAGLRLGYGIAAPELIGLMERARQPFNVNALAQAAGIAALDDRRYLKRTRAGILEGKRFLYGFFKSRGLAYVPSVANFVLVDVGCDGVEVFRKMLKLGVIVRDMQQYGLRNFIRVTIGTKKENEKFAKALKKVL